MTEEELYKADRDKIKENDISTWKYYPEGELKRKIYDYHNLLLKQFLAIYYEEYSNKEQWREQWMSAIVLPAFENDLVTLAKRLDVGVYKKFTNRKMTNFYSEIKDIEFFDSDIKLFFSWMNGMNFFEKQKISFQNWITSKNFNIGGRHQTEEDLYSLQDMAKEDFGNNLVRDKLMSLEWHKR